MTVSDNNLTLGQAAVRLGYTYRHVRRLVQVGKLRATIVAHTGRGPTWRITDAELRRFTAARRGA
jgi:excisionase family DNA binding protein